MRAQVANTRFFPRASPSARVASARTPWRRLPARGDAIDRKVVAGGTPRLGARLDALASPRRRLGDAMKTTNASSYDRSGGFGGGARRGVSKHSEYRVLVSGLPSSASWQDLKDHMRKAGDVCFSEVYREGGGTIGIVDYTNYDDMKYAIKKLDDTEFRNAFGRAYIRVKEYDGKRGRSYSRSRSPSRSYSRSRSPSKSPRARRSASRSRSRSVSSRSRSASKGRSPSRSPARSKSPNASPANGEAASPKKQSPSRSPSGSRSPDAKPE